MWIGSKKRKPRALLLSVLAFLVVSLLIGVVYATTYTQAVSDSLTNVSETLNTWWAGPSISDTFNNVAGQLNTWWAGPSIVDSLSNVGKSFSTWWTGLSNPVDVAFNICANFTRNSPMCSSVDQPVKFTAVGVLAQTVTLSPCHPSPSSLTGDGLRHDIGVDKSCVVTATLPTGFAWASTGTTTISTTTCATGTCTEWDGSYSATLTIVVETNPPNLSNGITVDGVTYSTTQTFAWTSGSTHTISAASVSGGYFFQSWSDAGAQTHTVTPTSSSTYIAVFSTSPSSAISLGVDSANQPLGGTAHLSATTRSAISSPNSIIIVDLSNSTNVASCSGSITLCTVSITSHHSNAQEFEAAITSTGHLAGSAANSTILSIVWGSGGSASPTTISVKATFTGGVPSGYPSFTYVYQGVTHTLVLTTSYQTVTVDQGTQWSVPSPYFSNLVNWFSHPNSGFVGSGWPYGAKYSFQYAQAPSCQNTGNAWTDLLNRCYFQFFYDLYQPTIGGTNAVALVLAAIDMSLYWKNKHVLIAAVILAVESVIFVGVAGFGLPSWLAPIGWTILALSLTAVVWAFFTRRKA